MFIDILIFDFDSDSYLQPSSAALVATAAAFYNWQLYSHTNHTRKQCYRTTSQNRLPIPFPDGKQFHIIYFTQIIVNTNNENNNID